ncbi:MAG: cation:proton antiporter [bacterium]|nr:cation:proton antiporter [bacterium]
MNFSLVLLLVLLTAVSGGFIAKSLKLQPLIGYIVGGIVLKVAFPSISGILQLAEIGAILLLFSVGLELPISKLTQVLKKIAVGTIMQLFAAGLVFYLIFLRLGIDPKQAFIFAYCFSLSSTILVLKILEDRGESDTVHGEIMTGWLLLQDLAIVPIVVLLPTLVSGPTSWQTPVLALAKALIVIVVTVLLGKNIAPYLIHKVASANSRELLILFALSLAAATAYVTGFLGVSPALGAFLAGVVISESQENHAVFAETRSLKDLFVAIFFVTIGLIVIPEIALKNIFLIFWFAVTVIAVKIIINFAVSVSLKYRGKPLVLISLGLSQVGEFAFVILSQALILGLLFTDYVSIAVSVALLTLIISPFIYKGGIPIWRWLKSNTLKLGYFGHLFRSGERSIAKENEYKDHIIICGYGRVGSWVGNAIYSLKIPHVIIDYNQKIVSDLKSKGLEVIYGDASEPEILDLAGIKDAKVVVLAIPDRASQEGLISYVQTHFPKVKIISRVHLNEDRDRLKVLRIFRIVQPEFEGSLVIIKSILVSLGRPNEEIKRQVKRIRMSYAKT